MIAPTSFFADYGCHVRIYEEARALQALGHQVTICTYHNGHDLPGLTIRRSLDVPWRKRLVVGSSRHKIYLDAVLSLEALRTALRVRPHLIHAHLHEGALIGGVLARLIRRPLLFDYQGSLTEEMIDHGFLRRNGRIQAAIRRLEQFIDHLPDRIITSSDNARERLRQRGYPSERLTTLLDAVDTDRFAPTAVSAAERAKLRQYFGIPEDARVIVYLGLLAPYQGSDLLLEAAQQVLAREPNAFFLVMGFPGNERYRLLAEQMGIAHRMSFPGRIPYLDAHRYLALGEVAVAPKMSLTEGNGKIYNYMAMGLPVVAFDAPANREIMGDLGIYATPGDATDFAARINWLLEHPEQGANRGLQLRERAIASLSWRARIHELMAIYHEVLGLPELKHSPMAPLLSGATDRPNGHQRTPIPGDATGAPIEPVHHRPRR